MECEIARGLNRAVFGGEIIMSRTRPKKRKGNSTPAEIRQVFRRLGIERQEDRQYFRNLRLLPRNVQPEYKIVTWLSGNSLPLSDHAPYA